MVMITQFSAIYHRSDRLKRLFPVVFSGTTLCLLIATGLAAASENPAPASIDEPIIVLIAAIAHMFSVLALKITAFIIGYKIAKLGYDTLIKGITGDLDFGFSSGKAISARLKSASPGTFFVLLGVALIAWGLFVDKPFESELLDKVKQKGTQTEQQQKVTAPAKTIKDMPGIK